MHEDEGLPISATMIDHWLVDDCSAFGLEMDCGHAFEINLQEHQIPPSKLLMIFLCLNQLYILDGDISIIKMRYKYAFTISIQLGFRTDTKPEEKGDVYRFDSTVGANLYIQQK